MDFPLLLREWGWLLPRLLAILIISALSYSHMFVFGRRARLLRKFPNVPALPIIGSLWVFLKHRGPEGTRDVIGNATKKLGRRWVIWMSHKPIIVVVDGKSSQAVLGSQKCVEKSSQYENFRWLFGHGLVTSPSHIWREDRKLLSPTFKFQSFDGFLAVFNKNAKMLVKIIAKTYKDGKEENMHPILCRASMDSVTANALGREANFQEDMEPLFMDAVYKALEVFRTKVVRPYLNIPILRQLYGFPKMEAFCKDMFYKYVDEAKKSRIEVLSKMNNGNGNNNMVQEPGTSYPFIDALLSSPTADVRGHIITIFAAGFETTASTMNYALYLLALNPHCQQKLHEEMDAIFGDDRERDVTFEDLADMKYLEMCVKEAMRIFPPIPVLIRTPEEDVELDDGLILPKGTDVAVAVHELHRDPDVFPDPEVFDPDRFLPENCVGRNPYAHVPFSAGPRNCLGMRYAWMQVKTTMAHMLRRFEIRTSIKQEDVREIYGMVLEHSPLITVTMVERPRN